MASATLDEINALERDWQLTLAQPSGPEKSRQLRLISQQREGLRAKRRRELAGYTYGRPPSPKANHSKVTSAKVTRGSTDPDPLEDLEGLVDGVFGSDVGSILRCPG